jgi:hypothetical protein
MKKPASKKKKPKSPKIFNPILADLRFHEERDQKYLRTRYRNPQIIIDELCEISTNLHTYEFLGELFFNFTVRELERDPPPEMWIRQLKNVRSEIMELYELARAAKALQLKKSMQQKPLY